jgi:hypothetical protein
VAGKSPMDRRALYAGAPAFRPLGSSLANLLEGTSIGGICEQGERKKRRHERSERQQLRFCRNARSKSFTSGALSFGGHMPRPLARKNSRPLGSEGTPDRDRISSASRILCSNVKCFTPEQTLCVVKLHSAMTRKRSPNAILHAQSRPAEAGDSPRFGGGTQFSKEG